MSQLKSFTLVVLTVLLSGTLSLEDTLFEAGNVTELQFTFRGVPGRDGMVGPTGPQGREGPTGPTGPQGAKGPTGPRGDVGPRGEYSYFTTNDSSESTIGSIHIRRCCWVDHITSVFLYIAGYPGPPGVQGAEGVRGPRGYAGLSGESTDYSVTHSIQLKCHVLYS